MAMDKINEIQLLNVNFLAALNELEKMGSKIRNAVTDPAQLDLLDLLNVEETKRTIERLHGEALENNKKLADILNGSEHETVDTDD